MAKLFLWIDYDPISVLYQFQIDISTNSREIKYQNIEKSLSLISERLVSMATTKITGPISRKTFGMVLGPEYISWRKIRTIRPVLWPVHREQTDKHANRGDHHTLRKSKISQSNKVKRHRIVMNLVQCFPGRVRTAPTNFRFFGFSWRFYS